MGHKAYVQRVKSGGKTLYRVSVGPKVEKARLEQIQGDIDARFGVKTLITRYYP
jgi:DedD protein